MVQELFDIVRGGKVPSFALKAEGSSPTDLLEIEKSRSEGSREEGTGGSPEARAGIK